MRTGWTGLKQLLTIATALAIAGLIARRSLSGPETSDSSVVMNEVGRFPIPEHIDLATTRIAVAVTESRIFLGAPPLAADSVYVFGFDGTRIGSVYVRLDPGILGISWVLGLPGDRAALLLFPGRVGTMDGRSLRIEQWRYAGIMSLDAVLGDSAFASAQQVPTPDLFGHWWYWGLFAGEALVPVDEKLSVGLMDTPLFGLHDAGDRGICGLNADPPVIKCWDTQANATAEYQLRADEPGGHEGGLRGVAIRNDLLWLVIETESKDSKDTANSDNNMASGEPYAPSTYRVVARPLEPGETTVGVMFFRGRFVRFTPNGHLVTLEQVGDHETVVVHQLELAGATTGVVPGAGSHFQPGRRK